MQSIVKPIISIIVPVYNTEKYLDSCIQSILNQTYLDFELILINDGSTDSSLEICQKYSEKDKRIILVNQHNGGVSAARNRGIELARGEWISFVDSDDWLDITFLNDFLNHLSPDVDLLIQGMIQYPDSKKIYSFNIKRELSIQSFLFEYNILPYFFSPCSKFFKRSIIKENNLFYNESISYGEDTLFNLDYALVCVSNIFLLESSGYHYRVVQDGLSSKKLNFKERYELLNEIKNKLKYLSKSKKHYYWYVVETIKSLYYDKAVVNTYKELKIIGKEFRSELLYAYKDKGFVSNLTYYLFKIKFYKSLDFLFKYLNREK